MIINDKEIVLAPYTRSIARQVNEKLLEGVIVSGAGGDQSMAVPAVNADKSEQLLVQLMTGLSPSEVDALLMEDYTALKIAILEKIGGEKKG